ncbi:MAG TPA: sialidase family protein [Candidatus Thermoplasmatota archaeon]|nr:sialidase family protein [Candidatus Thermoplasmatota archaeon]
MRAVLVVLLVVLAAGCVAQPDVAPAATTDAPTPRLLPTKLVAPKLLALAELGPGFGEPEIAAAPDGTLYVAAVNDIYRSDDAGATWVEAKLDLDGGGDGDIAVGPDGRVHWLGLFAKDAPIPYYASDDKGDSWTKPVDLSNKTGSDREWIDARQDSPWVYTAWRDSDDDGIVAFRSSADGGATWNDRVAISEDAIAGPLVHGPANGSVYQAQATFSSGPTSMDAGIRLARSHDHGATWDVVPIVTPPQSVQFGIVGLPFSIFPVIAADDAGTLYVAYAVDQEMLPSPIPLPKSVARFGVFLQTSEDDGETWTQPRLLSSPDHAAIMPFVVAGAKGRIAIAWYENTYGLPNDNLPDSWNTILYESIDADTEAPQEQWAQLNEAPTHLGSICTNGAGCFLTGGDRSLLDFLEIAIAPSGQPVVTFASTDRPHQGTFSEIHVMARGVEEGTPLR